ncbi:MAG: N-acetyl-gamma-glutamyl-phosphate reductase [Actinobacteria bacterium 13_2_20CM_2_71_6]|nr:MAG: N-acetyl-gamma-glutamyl-phosphate reductase [Actinobacteria bacterium 13_2_20CM_2_71_6]
MTARVTAAVLGATGFIGAELVRLLGAHPSVDLVFTSSEQQAGQRIGQVVPGLRHGEVGRHELRSLTELPKVDVAIACLPNGVLPAHLDAVCAQANLVINVAGDFRLRDPAEAARHYPGTVDTGPPATEYHVPELSPKPAVQVVSLPGCMAVAALYALYPLYRSQLAEPEVVVDAKTGSSGSGAGSVEHPAVRDGNVRVHRLHGHRHGPELRQALADLIDVTPDVQFSTYSLPVARGVFVSAYSRLRPGVGAPEVRRAYAHAYRRTRFVRLANGRNPMAYPMLKTVVGSNVAEVGVAVNGDRCVSVAALDNLLKGGAGQAVQTLNRCFDLDEHLGLPELVAWP